MKPPEPSHLGIWATPPPSLRIPQLHPLPPGKLGPFPSEPVPPASLHMSVLLTLSSPFPAPSLRTPAFTPAVPDPQSPLCLADSCPALQALLKWPLTSHLSLFLHTLPPPTLPWKTSLSHRCLLHTSPTTTPLLLAAQMDICPLQC